jgi:ATP-dependent Lon protease
VDLDASQVFWVLTANSLEGIPPALLSRMAVYDVPAPTPEQAAAIAQRVYSGLLAELKLQNIDPDLTEGVLGKLSEVSPREMRKSLLDALGYAVAAGRSALLPEDVRVKADTGKRKIGF